MAQFGLKTVRAKLIATTMAVIAVVLVVLGFTVDWSARSTMLGVIDRDLKMRGEDLARNFEQGGGMPRGAGPGGPPPGGGFRGGEGPQPGGQGEGQRRRGLGPRDNRMSAPIVMRVRREPGDPGPPPPVALDAKAHDAVFHSGPLFTTVELDGEPRRVYTTVSRRDGAIENVIQLSYPLGEVLDALSRLRGILLTIMLPLGMLLAGGASLFVVGRLLTPLRRMACEAERIGGQQLSERIRVMGEDEFAALGATLNGMLERIEQSFEQQRRFTADASHELKTPLAVIKANIGIVRHGKPTAEEARESAEAIDLAADRMGALVRDLLLLARTDAGRSASEFRECSLVEVVREAIRSVPGANGRVSIKATEESVSVLASPEDLSRVFVNLADNALKYSERDTPVVIEISASDGEASVTVSDQGEGIGEQHQAHLFERFYRPDESRTRSSGGTGLGLAICKGIVEAHRGTIRVWSERGKGTTVQVNLPEAPIRKGSETASSTQDAPER